LHLETISANGEALAGHLLELLEIEYLFDAGWQGAKWKSFADAAKAAYPYLSEANRIRVEEVIVAHKPEIDYAIEMSHEIREHGKNESWQNRERVIHLLNQSGWVQWCTLETIGEHLLTSFGVKCLEKLRRKFPNKRLPEPTDHSLHIIGSRINREKAVHMKDEHWLNAINEYNSEHRRGMIDMGAGQLGIELQNATKGDPIRFAALMKRIPATANRSYVSHI